MPCREWFAAQPVAYCDAVLPPAVRARVSVEAGIGQSWCDVVGDAGRIISLEHFGASADYQRLYREFGITPQAEAAAVRASTTPQPTSVPGGHPDDGRDRRAPGLTSDVSVPGSSHRDGPRTTLLSHRRQQLQQIG